MSDILFKTEDHIFSYRVGGVLIREGKALLQRAAGEDGYALIGGHVAFGETTAETLVREFREELGADIRVERLLMVNENFFAWGSRPCQQINLYYLVSLTDETQIPLSGSFWALDECGGERVDLEMCWISLEEIAQQTLYPAEAKPYLLHLPSEIVHIVHRA